MHLPVGFFLYTNNTVEILGYIRGAVCLVSHRVQNETKSPNQKPKHAENDTNLSVTMRTEAGAEMISVVHCTKLELTVIQIAASTENKKTSEISVSSFTMMEAILTELQLIYM